MSRQDTPSSGTSRRVREPRIVQVDNLKSLLVAWIIACHAVVGYTAIGGWPYDEVAEVTSAADAGIPAFCAGWSDRTFRGRDLLLRSGLFAPVEMARHGVSSFMRTRLLRLGVPWVLFTVLVWPLFMWFAYRAAGHELSYWQVFRGRTPFLDSGPLWFVQVLLYASFGYALWTWRGWGRRFQEPPSGAFT